MKKYLPIFINKYLLAFLFVFVWVLFFDDTDFFTQQKRLKELNMLKQKEAYFKKQTELAKQELNAIETNDETLEKFAREKYFFKKKGEEIFVIDNPHQ